MLSLEMIFLFLSPPVVIWLPSAVLNLWLYMMVSSNYRNIIKFQIRWERVHFSCSTNRNARPEPPWPRLVLFQLCVYLGTNQWLGGWDALIDLILVLNSIPKSSDRISLAMDWEWGWSRSPNGNLGIVILGSKNMSTTCRKQATSTKMILCPQEFREEIIK